MGSVKDFWLTHPRIDVFLALLGLAAVTLGHLNGERGVGVAGVVAGVAGALLGTSAVVMGLYQTSQEQRTRDLVQAHWRSVNRNWAGILLHFATASVVALAATFVPSEGVLRMLLGYALLLTAVTTVRLSWFLITYFSLQGPVAADRDAVEHSINW